MGIFDFMKNAGEKILKPGEAKKEAAIKAHLDSFGSDFAKVTVEVDGDTAALTGSVPSTAAREKAVLIAGNIDGVGKVDDRLTVTGGASKPSFSNVSGGVASTEAPVVAGGGSGGGGGTGAVQASAGDQGWQSKTYTVKAGDSLSKIAKEFYGEANKYNQIFEANQPMLKDPDKIYPGQVLRIPPEA
jgi:nucleoid-associated protein YgaU